MTDPIPDQSETYGVVFADGDHLGFWKRLSMDVIDVAIALAALLTIDLVVGIVLIMVVDDLPLIKAFGALTLMIGLPVVWLCYFVVLRALGFRTLGYKLFRAKLVNLHGQPLGWLALGLRVMFFFLGPMNLLFDLVWMTGDETKQAVRDKFTHAYVVRATANPIGRGRMVYRRYDVLGWSFLFQEVSRVELPPAR